jgi:hypothetical protein
MNEIGENERNCCVAERVRESRILAGKLMNTWICETFSKL